MEKTLETIKNINVDKVIKAVYISAMILLTTVLLIDYLLHQTMTWSLITTTAIIGTMLLFTVIRLTYKNMKHLIFGLLSTVLIISVPIVYSVGLYLNITDWVMTTFTPLLIGSLVSVAVAYVYFSISKSNVWIKVHISVIIIDVINVVLQLFIMNNKFTVIPNVVGLIVLLTTLPITINYTKNKQ